MEVAVEQQGVQGTGVAASARTVLPGEPFDPPAASAVPGPREVPPAGQPLGAQPPAAFGAQQFPGQPFGGMPQQFPQHAQPSVPAQQQPLQQPFGAQLAPPAYGQQLPAYGTVDAVAPQAGYGPATQAPGIPDAAEGFETLHEYASLPVADANPSGLAQPGAIPHPSGPTPPAFGSPAPAAFAPQAAPASFPAAPAGPQYQPYAGPQFPPQPGTVLAGGQPNLPPLPPLQLPAEEDSGSAGDHRRSGRKQNKALLAVLLVAVLGGGGYFGYSHFLKKSDSSSEATTPATTPVAPTATAHRYAFPSALGGYQLQSSAASASLKAPVAKFVKQVFPSYSRTLSFAAYHVGSPQVYAWTIRPGSTHVAAAYATLQNRVQAFRTPGTVFLPMTATAPGAAGGQMTCGSQRGNAAASYCIWHNSTTIGYFTVTGSGPASDTVGLTRELRAYAEH